MGKYLCTCGEEFKNKNTSDYHAKTYNDLQSDWRHIIMKKNFRGRLIDWLLDMPWPKIFKLVGIYIIWMVIIRHFNIDFNTIESVLLGLGLGLVV